jgi:hypothetical protein
LIKKENLEKIIGMLSLDYIFYPDETAKKLIIELLKVLSKDKPTGTDLKNAFGRILYPEKKEITIDQKREFRKNHWNA